MIYLFIGSANRSGGRLVPDQGISVYVLDEERLESELVCVCGDIDNPTFLAVDPDSRTVFAVSEVADWAEGTVSSYRFDPGRGQLDYSSKQPTLGRSTCHVAVLPGGRVGVANYSTGHGGPARAWVLYERRPDGTLSPPVASAAHSGELGPYRERQDRSHAHCVTPTADGRYVLVADLGLDAVFAYSLANPHEPAFVARTPPGAGPRHIACHPNNRFVYVANELAGTVSTYRYDGAGMRHVGDEPTPAAADDSGAHGAEIALSADARFLYMSTRKDDAMTTFALNGEGERPTAVQTIPSGGRCPRSFALTPSGLHVLVANQETGSVEIFRRDVEDGRLAATGASIAVPRPMCVQPVDWSAGQKGDDP